MSRNYKKKHNYKKQISQEISNLFNSLHCNLKEPNKKRKDAEERPNKKQRSSKTKQKSDDLSEDLDKLTIPYFNKKCQREHKFIDDDILFIKCERCGFFDMKN